MIAVFEEELRNLTQNPSQIFCAESLVRFFGSANSAAPFLVRHLFSFDDDCAWRGQSCGCAFSAFDAKSFRIRVGRIRRNHNNRNV